ncbi:MAG: hypothetical protein ACTS45_00765 [Candidatus Hodgkinia cicadicola]
MINLYPLKALNPMNVIKICGVIDLARLKVQNKLINQSDVIVRKKLNNLNVKTYHGSYDGGQPFFGVLS